MCELTKTVKNKLSYTKHKRKSKINKKTAVFFLTFCVAEFGFKLIIKFVIKGLELNLYIDILKLNPIFVWNL